MGPGGSSSGVQGWFKEALLGGGGVGVEGGGPLTPTTLKSNQAEEEGPIQKS